MKTQQVLPLVSAALLTILSQANAGDEVDKNQVPKAVLERPTPDVQPDAEWTWIYSGNLGRAHEWETLLRAQQLIEQRGVARHAVVEAAA